MPCSGRRADAKATPHAPYAQQLRLRSGISHDDQQQSFRNVYRRSSYTVRSCVHVAHLLGYICLVLGDIRRHASSHRRTRKATSAASCRWLRFPQYPHSLSEDVNARRALRPRARCDYHHSDYRKARRQTSPSRSNPGPKTNCRLRHGNRPCRPRCCQSSRHSRRQLSRRKPRCRFRACPESVLCCPSAYRAAGQQGPGTAKRVETRGLHQQVYAATGRSPAIYVQRRSARNRRLRRFRYSGPLRQQYPQTNCWQGSVSRNCLERWV